MNRDEAVLALRSDPLKADLVRNAYLSEDVEEAAKRFAESGEFQEVLHLLGDRAFGTVLDLGAGTGIASYAFAQAGAAQVYALEPDDSDVVGVGALRKILGDFRIEIISAWGEQIPLPDASLDTVYMRAVLHHTKDLARIMNECYRILRPGGRLLVTREHVVDDEAQLKQFLKAHPLHHMTGDEYAYQLSAYVEAMKAARFELEAILGPWDSVLNAYPLVERQEDLKLIPEKILAKQFGLVGQALARMSFIRRWIFHRLNRPKPGRLYSFLAKKKIEGPNGAAK